MPLQAILSVVKVKVILSSLIADHMTRSPLSPPLLL
jgi:hypothetical protein